MPRHPGTPLTSAVEFTPREEDVLALASHGRTNSEIAETLGITQNAVRYHLKQIHSKLGTDGDRGLLLWQRVLAWPAFVAARVGGATFVVSLGVVFGLAGAAALAYGAVDDSSATRTEVTQVIHAWPGATLSSFEVPGRISLETLRRLNPRFGPGELPSDAEVVVPVLPNGQRITIQPTPPADGAGPVGGNAAP